MKVLIITYYWPPAGGSGVQRWLKFVKYLRGFGIEPVVYTIKNPQYPILDAPLEIEIPNGVEVIRQPIWEPNNFLSIFKKEKSQSAGFLKPNPSFFGKILQYIRANYFIPDARKFWIKPSVKYLEKYLTESPVDLIISTGPPHSLHLIGFQLKQKLNIKWISDFRDPWTDIDYFHQLPLTKKTIKKHKELEQKVLLNSDAVLVVGKTMKENYLKFNKNIHVITNGFDMEISSSNIPLDKQFSITHIGMMNADRNPKKLWNVLAEICSESNGFKNDLQVHLIGEIANEVRQGLKLISKENIKLIPYLSHEDVHSYQLKSQILLLAINNVPSSKGIVTGKIFEYLQAKRPILAIGPIDGDAAEIIKNTKSGVVVDFEDDKKLKKVILDMYQQYKKKELKVNSIDIDLYHRKELTKKLSEIIKDTISK